LDDAIARMNDAGAHVGVPRWLIRFGFWILASRPWATDCLRILAQQPVALESVANCSTRRRAMSL
jgi:hypothetical protein